MPPSDKQAELACGVTLREGEGETEREVCVRGRGYVGRGAGGLPEIRG